MFGWWLKQHKKRKRLTRWLCTPSKCHNKLAWRSFSRRNTKLEICVCSLRKNRSTTNLHSRFSLLVSWELPFLCKDIVPFLSMTNFVSTLSGSWAIIRCSLLIFHMNGTSSSLSKCICLDSSMKALLFSEIFLLFVGSCDFNNSYRAFLISEIFIFLQWWTHLKLQLIDGH